ncbi:MAG: uncharacterized protein H6R26_1985 [Proteobacteria bacterium]|nr:uncharacterized protein [Pseudomonadota bacterium]
MTQHSTIPRNSGTSQQAGQKILEALQGLRYGAVEITVHDGRIVQIERKEKVRLELACPTG